MPYILKENRIPLNKNVCIRCCNEFKGIIEDETKSGQWDIDDENRWIGLEKVVCPNKGQDCNHYREESILYLPLHCPNGLEHIIANREEEIDKKELADVK